MNIIFRGDFDVSAVLFCGYKTVKMEPAVAVVAIVVEVASSYFVVEYSLVAIVVAFTVSPLLSVIS